MSGRPTVSIQAATRPARAYAGYLHPLRHLAFFLAVMFAPLFAGCSAGAAAPPSASPSAPPATASGPRPSSPAHVTILAPANGAVVHGASVPVHLELSGAKIVDMTTTHITPTEGHIHVYLDTAIVSMNYSLDSTLESVTPGQHVLRVEFVAADHAPFYPRVISNVVFTDQP